MALTDLLRDRQLELNRTLRAMDEANERLALSNQRLQEAREVADESRMAKGRFASSVSHELRTPLNLIIGFTEVMYGNATAHILTRCFRRVSFATWAWSTAMHSISCGLLMTYSTWRSWIRAG